MSRSSRLQCGPSWSGLRRVPLRRVSPLRSRPVLLPTDARRALETRSGGVCEVAREGCLGVAMDPHHRLLRQAGGRHGAARPASDRLSNLLFVCRVCHAWIHSYRAAAREAGWVLGGREVPPLEPVVYRGVPRYLADDGRVADFEQVGA